METKTYKPIDFLHSWDKNPRTITKEGFERLLEQIKRLGQYKPLLITEDGTVLGGNMRLKAYQELGVKDVWVSIVDAPTEEKKIEYALSDNDRAGKYELDQLNDLVGSYEGVPWDKYAVDVVDPINLQELMDRYKEGEEDEAPLLSTETPDSKTGQVYILGNHRLMCGDAQSHEDVTKLMGGGRADMVFTDPPYNIAYDGGGGYAEHGTTKRDKIKNDNMSSADFKEFLKKTLTNMLEVCDGPFYVFMSSKELPNLKQAFEESGGHWQSFIIWVKNHFTLSRSDYQQQYEPMLYGWKEGVVDHFFIDDRSQGNVWEDVGNKAKWDGQYTEITVGGVKLRFEGKVKGQIVKGKTKTDIWRYDRPMKSEEHPTMKPVRLCAEGIRNSSMEGQIVLDLFGGSGSTLIAAEQFGRRCYMMEMDEHYCDVIRKRYAKFIDKENEWKTLTAPQN